MTEFLPSSALLVGLLLTHLIHSTFVVAVVGCLLRLCVTIKPELRVLSWKLALTLPLATTVAVTAFDVPHLGIQYVIGDEMTALCDTDRLEPRSGQSRFVLADATLDSDRQTTIHEQSSSTSMDQRRADARSVPPGGRWFSQIDRSVTWSILALLWLVGVASGCLGLAVRLRRLRQLRRRARRITDPDFLNAFRRLQKRAGLRRPVDLLQSAGEHGPLTAGVLRPFVLVASPQMVLRRPERDALLAHELAHVVSHDPLWNLITQLIVRFLFFQPLNRLAGRQLRKEMDFVADLHAARWVGERSGLAQCLIWLGQRLADSQPKAIERYGLASGMASFRSTLGQRIERLLDEEREQDSATRTASAAVAALMVVGSVLTASVAPRALAELPANQQADVTDLETGNESMKKQITNLAVLAGLTMPAVANDEREPPDAQAPSTVLKTNPDELPEGINNFRGMLVGRLAAKDVEKGTFLVQVDAVPRVWRNSKAEDPKCIVGKTVEIGGVFGKFLDVLVVTKTGETLEFESRFDGGNRLTFPGELLRKVAPYRPEDYPVLPEPFRGFHGAVTAHVLKKDPETFELIVKVDRVIDTWKENKAKSAQSIEGKKMMLAGFWRRKEAYHGLNVGDRIEVGLQHIGLRSDHLTVTEFVRKLDEHSPPEREVMKRQEGAPADGLTKELRGFRGMLVGRLVRKDVERGTFTVTVDAVPRVWNNNQASNPKSYLGKTADAGGVTGKMLDVLVVARIGETVEFGALHDGGDRLRVGEVLRKVAPVKPGHYPELPDDARGFRGMVVAKVVRKDTHLMEVIAEVKEIKTLFPNSRAQNAESIIGKQVMLAGFWKRKDAFHSLNAGDVFECGLEHPQLLSDHLSVFESVKKISE